MAVQKNPKAAKRKKLRQLIDERKSVDAEIKALEERKSTLGKDIQSIMADLGETKFEGSAEGVGYELQTPMQTLYHEDALQLRLKKIAPGVAKRVFKKVTVFDRKEFEVLIEAGSVPDADTLLADDEIVSFKPMTPRLMPLQSEKGKKK